MRRPLSLEYIPGNQVSILIDGPAAYTAIETAINEAQHSIQWANFYWEPGRVWNRISRVLLAAAERGVAVQVLADAYGAKALPPADIDRLRQAGVDWRAYNPWQLLRFWRYNRRLHKKVMVIDDAIGLTGGVGVADFWMAKARHYPRHWRDTHFMIKGPAVAAMAAGFNESWQRSGGELLKTPPSAAPKAGIPIATINSPAGGGLTPVGQLYIDLVNQARVRLTATTAYFGPDRQLRQALLKAAERGVSVCLLINGPHTTHRSALQAGRHYYRPLLKAGVHIYEYQPTSVHAKLMTIDGRLSSIGSGNLNMRSLRHDDEFNMVVDDTKLAGELEARFEQDIKDAKLITYKDWQRRPLSTRVMQAVCSLGRYFF